MAEMTIRPMKGCNRLEVWSSKILKKYYKKTVLTAISNTDYAGEIKAFGDKVYIRTIADVSTFTYRKGMTLPISRPESPDVELLIDQGQGWNLYLDDVDKIQSDLPLLEKWTGDAVKQLDIAVDAAVLGAVYADADAYNCGATAGKITARYNLGASGAPVQITKDNVLSYIIDAGSVLGENDVDEEGCWMVIPEVMAGMIQKSDIREVSVSGDSKSIIRTNTLGKIGRFVLYTSNNMGYVAAGTESSGFQSFYILFGNRDAITFAMQVDGKKTQNLVSPTSFDQIVRGLMIYGYKVAKGQGLGYIYGRF
jgi:hypothetical protein